MFWVFFFFVLQFCLFEQFYKIYIHNSEGLYFCPSKLIQLSVNVNTGHHCLSKKYHQKKFPLTKPRTRPKYYQTFIHTLLFEKFFIISK